MPASLSRRVDGTPDSVPENGCRIAMASHRTAPKLAGVPKPVDFRRVRKIKSASDEFLRRWLVHVSNGDREGPRIPSTTVYCGGRPADDSGRR